MGSAVPLFDRLRWRDPVSGAPLEPVVTARTPAGGPICGALRVAGTVVGYPIVDGVARLTPELAERYREWLTPLGLQPPRPGSGPATFQSEGTVESFGFQWAWNSAMRSEADLQWRVADRFRVAPREFAGRLVLDAGAGAGDQSRWLIARGADVVSVDLSSAIDVVAGKLRLSSGWVGVQGDITALPLAEEQVDIVYCEGVIQHTRDSAMTARELSRVLRVGGRLLATHYERPARWLGRAKLAFVTAVRARLVRRDRYALLWLTGGLAALAYVPLLGAVVRRTGLALYQGLMPDFKTTWTNTYDWYGQHAYQRYLTPEEFWETFQRAGSLERVYADGGVIVAMKTAAMEAGSLRP